MLQIDVISLLIGMAVGIIITLFVCLVAVIFDV